MSLPLSLARAALRFVPSSARARMEEEGVSLDELQQLVADVRNIGPLKLVEVEDGADRVEVFLE